MTAVVGEVLAEGVEPNPDLSPLLVGSAAELPRRAPRTNVPGRFRRHDTGELEPVPADLPPGAAGAIHTDPVDPEELRYAPREQPRFLWIRRILATMLALGVVGIGIGAGIWWAQQQYYVGEQDGKVTIYRGLQGNLLGQPLSEPFETTNLDLDQLSDVDAESVREGMDAGTLDDAKRVVKNLNDRAEPAPAADGQDSATP